MHPPPTLTGDPRTDWALWRLSLVITEIAAATLRQERLAPMPSELCDERDPVPFTDPHPQRSRSAWDEESK